jgi:hypothetical protein
VTIAPVAQIKASARGSDRGDNASDPVASGFQRVLLAPGIEFNLHPVKVDADVERHVYQHFTGDQLSAPALFTVTVSMMF